MPSVTKMGMQWLEAHSANALPFVLELSPYARRQDLDEGDLQVSYARQPKAYAWPEIHCRFCPDEAGGDLQFQYDSVLFDESLMHRIGSGLQRVLDRVCRNPQMKLREIPG